MKRNTELCHTALDEVSKAWHMCVNETIQNPFRNGDATLAKNSIERKATDAALRKIFKTMNAHQAQGLGSSGTQHFDVGGCLGEVICC